VKCLGYAFRKSNSDVSHKSENNKLVLKSCSYARHEGMQAHSGNRSTAHSQPRGEVSGQHQAPADLSLGMNPVSID
jgi:hypothetical protein